MPGWMADLYNPKITTDNSPQTPRQRWAVGPTAKAEESFREKYDVSALSTAAGSTSTSRSRSYSPHHLRKPKASRVMLDALPLKTMLEMHLAPCLHCRSRLEVSFPTLCVASGCKIQCPEPSCYVAKSEPESTEFVVPARSSEKIDRNTHYATNILFVVGFVHSGDGGTVEFTKGQTKTYPYCAVQICTDGYISPISPKDAIAPLQFNFAFYFSVVKAHNNLLHYIISNLLLA